MNAMQNLSILVIYELTDGFTMMFLRQEDGQRDLITNAEQSIFVLGHLQVREWGHVGPPEAGEPLGEHRQRHEAQHPHLHHLQLPAARGL